MNVELVSYWQISICFAFPPNIRKREPDCRSVGQPGEDSIGCDFEKEALTLPDVGAAEIRGVRKIPGKR